MGKVASDLRVGERMKEVEVIPRGMKTFFWLREGEREERERVIRRVEGRRRKKGKVQHIQVILKRLSSQDLDELSNVVGSWRVSELSTRLEEERLVVVSLAERTKRSNRE